MPFTSNAIRYSTIMVITKAQELVKTCAYADKCLGEVLSHLSEDTMLTDKQKQVVMHHAIASRETLQKTMKIFTEVTKIWDQGCASKQPPKDEREL